MESFIFGININWSAGIWHMGVVIANGVLRMSVWGARVIKKNKSIRIATVDIVGHGGIHQRTVLCFV